MERRFGLRAGRPWWAVGAVGVVAVGLVAACGPDVSNEEPEGEPVAEVAAVEQPQDSAGGTLRRFLPDEMRRSTRAETFPHPAHAQIDCAVCHEVPAGHGSHGTLACAACHRASASITVRSLAPADCQACHHSAQQTWGCEHCHGTPGPAPSEQLLALEVWSAPRTRTLAFDHARHASLDCARCHRAEPSLAPESCASCHESHHVATVRCQSCHTPPPAAAHDVDAHLTCSGSGCHRASDVEAIADTRAVCLVCHQVQEEHEPGGRCIDCHRVRPGAAGRVGP